VFEVVMCSKSAANVKASIGALRDAGEKATVIIVWDGEHPLNRLLSPEEMKRLAPFAVIGGVKPFCFARNCNIGITYALPEDDIVLMNDDVVLLTDGGLTRLASAADVGGWGILSPRVQGPANPAHMFSSHFTDGISPVGRMLPFCCVFIARRLLQDVGPLDERFVPGSFEDDDYCRRAKAAGFRFGVVNTVTIDHQMLPSSFRPADGPPLYDLGSNRRRYFEKWGNLG
jgi:GT2 family glycosyltransferase